MADETFKKVLPGVPIIFGSGLAGAGVREIESAIGALSFTPGGLALRSGVAFAVGCAVGGISAGLQGERNWELVRSGLETGVGAALGAATFGALGGAATRIVMPQNSVAVAHAASSLAMCGVSVGTILGFETATGGLGQGHARPTGAGALGSLDVSSQRKRGAPTIEVIPTKLVGQEALSGTLFGRPERYTDGTRPAPAIPALFVGQTLPPFPDGMNPLACPYMKSETPYPPELYIAGWTELLHAVTVPHFLTEIYKSFGDGDATMEVPKERKPILGALPREGAPDGRGEWITQYKAGLTVLDKGMTGLIESGNRLRKALLDKYGETEGMASKHYARQVVNKICDDITVNAKKPPSGMSLIPAPGSEDSHVLQYLQEAVQAGTNLLDDMKKEAADKAREVGHLTTYLRVPPPAEQPAPAIGLNRREPPDAANAPLFGGHPEAASLPVPTIQEFAQSNPWGKPSKSLPPTVTSAESPATVDSAPSLFVGAGATV